MGKREGQSGKRGSRLTKEILKHCIDCCENSSHFLLTFSLSILKKCFLGLAPAGLQADFRASGFKDIGQFALSYAASVLTLG